MAQYKVVVVSLGYETYQYEHDILNPIGAEVIISPIDCTTGEEVIEVAKDADAILVRETPVTAEVLESFERGKIVSRYGVGLDNIDLETAKKLRIYVSNVPEYGTEDVSDHAVALLLGCIRTLLVRDQNLRRGIFETDIRAPIYRTTGKILGIVGYSKIARAFHRKWQGFLPERVLVYDPFVDQGQIQEMGAEKMDLETLAQQTGYDRDYLEKVEQGKISPAVGTLIQISRALAVDSASLLAEDRKKERRRSYRKRTKAYSYKNLIPGAEDKHLWAYLITLEPKKTHESVEYKHEGEEFLYVLEGRVQVQAGRDVHTVKKGKSLHFNSAQEHLLKNLSSKESKLIVVVYVP